MNTKNRAKIEFLSISANEGFSRVCASAFASQLDPTLEEISDIKTAVSEAVTNAIVHAYQDSQGMITMEMWFEEDQLHICISDKGCGIGDVDQAMQPFYSTVGGEERSGMGFTVMQTFMDEVKVTSTVGEGTIVSMAKRIKSKEQE